MLLPLIEEIRPRLVRAALGGMTFRRMVLCLQQVRCDFGCVAEKELRAGGGLNVREIKEGETVEAPLNGYRNTEKPYSD
jgi:hypothetical protein